MLIADDDPLIVTALADRCARMGFEIETATNGLQAMIKASRSKPDILVIDVNMPEADGLSVCAHLLDPDKRPMDVIVVTGRRDAETVERCDGFGAFYAKKGPEFWSSLEAALAELFPDMADDIRAVGNQSASVEMKTRSRVLIVDNDPEYGTFLSSRLAKQGIDMLYAADAQQGLRIASRDRPSVIVAEYAMPNGDARYLLGKLRITAATASIPVVVLSEGRLGDAARDVLLREISGHPGAVRVLEKSFETHELFEELQKFCGFAKN
jgi:DNA-binding response OmpR family regulator